jgi:hypothetical protein
MEIVVIWSLDVFNIVFNLILIWSVEFVKIKPLWTTFKRGLPML